MSDREMEILVDTADGFLRAGGVLRYEDWEKMDENFKAAFIVAGNRVWVERAAMVGLAAQSLDGYATVMSGIDGGDTKVRLSLERICNKLESR